MNTLDVKLKLNNLHCFEEGDGIGSAEPYLWTVFFKIDGDTARVSPALALTGTATVRGTPGNQGDLPNHDVDPGENVPIPAVIGEFRTRLKPIPLEQPVGNVKEVGGVVGVITVLMEEDNTPNSAIAKGHVALDKAVRESLNALVPTLNFAHQEPTDAEIEQMKARIGAAVTKAIKDDVSVWEWLGGFGNMDDRIGSEVFRFSHKELERAGAGGLEIRKRFKNEGDWELQGRVTASPVSTAVGSLQITLRGIPTAAAVVPVRVTGPGFSKAVGRSTTLTGLPAGTYTITAGTFTTGLPGKPTCRFHTPDLPTQQRTVAVGQTASVSVSYTSEPCDA
ncbi:hypothetical protein [Calidithermus chliarophilus]|uniref:hypothetical protein n=1 Tax=Calidithermus chliarophilus TaxID=52023 RepID=UPI000409B67B|nr:hypothetical protein [Calidithermus chliarophilus]